MNLTFGYSPCPNDTYMFASIANESTRINGDKVSPFIADVETLNSMAFSNILDISKLSFYTYFQVKKKYQLLLNGGVMGFGCGPILISKKMLNKRQICKSRIVFPGELTTAHLLFRMWEPDAKHRIFTTYDKIVDFLNNDRADCGVVIHESRFVFEKLGFTLLVDLGSWWETNTGMPVPLGCIAAKKTLGKIRLRKIDKMLRSSLKVANSNPEKVFPYVKKFAKELSEYVLQQHIVTFVNNLSLGFGDIGLAAIDKLYSEANAIGLVK